MPDVSRILVSALAEAKSAALDRVLGADSMSRRRGRPCRAGAPTDALTLSRFGPGDFRVLVRGRSYGSLARPFRSKAMRTLLIAAASNLTRCCGGLPRLGCRRRSPGRSALRTGVLRRDASFQFHAMGGYGVRIPKNRQYGMLSARPSSVSAVSTAPAISACGSVNIFPWVVSRTSRQ